MKVLLFDLETTGLIDRKFKKDPPVLCEVDRFPDIIQIAWIVIDTESNTESKTEEELIKRCYYLEPRAPFDDIIQRITGITNEECKRKSKSKQFVLAQFLIDLSGVDAICAHNLEFFDLPILRAQLMREKMYFDLPSSLKRIDTIRYRGRFIKLSNLYLALHGEEVDSSKLHTALYDTEVLLKCFRKLWAKGELKVC